MKIDFFENSLVIYGTVYELEMPIENALAPAGAGGRIVVLFRTKKSDVKGLRLVRNIIGVSGKGKKIWRVGDARPEKDGKNIKYDTDTARPFVKIEEIQPSDEDAGRDGNGQVLATDAAGKRFLLDPETGRLDPAGAD